MKMKMKMSVGMVAVLLLASMSVQADVLRNSAPGDTVTYSVITETLSSLGGGSFTGSYNTPNINGDQLVFDAVNLESAAYGGDFIRGDAQLNFFVEADPGFNISEVRIGEAGDGSLSELVVPSGGTATTRTKASATLIVDILEVDHDPYYGAGGSDSGTFGSFSMSVPADLLYTWSGGLVVDVAQILADSGYEYDFGATKLSVKLDNLLEAYSQANTLAVIKKKGADALAITAVSVPEPASVAMLIGTTTGLVFIRRRLIA